MTSSAKSLPRTRSPTRWFTARTVPATGAVRVAQPRADCASDSPALAILDRLSAAARSESASARAERALASSASLPTWLLTSCSARFSSLAR